MPKLLMFVACEKVIIDQKGVPSLISIFQRMQIILQDAPLPENAMSPTLWHVFALWEHTKDEIGQDFTQRVEVFTPLGVPSAFGLVNFKVTEERDLQSKNTFQFFGLPINDEGFIRIVTTVDGSPEPVAEYKFFLEHLRGDQHGSATIEGTEHA